MKSDKDGLGDEVAAWFSAFLQHPCRLVRCHPTTHRLANTKWTGEQAIPTLFSDGFPLLLLSTASLADLNQKLLAQGRAALPMARFRPNIVIDGVDAFEEDYTESIIIDKVERSVVIKPVKPCPRCPIPSVDQTTGEFGPDPLDILHTYRASPLLDGAVTFGMNVIVTQGAGQTICVGDAIAITLAFD